MKKLVDNPLTTSALQELANSPSLQELLDLEKISELLEQFYLATGLANAILDLHGNILFGIGWKSICTEFHRKNSISAARCLRSDTFLANKLLQKEKYAVYTCENGMVDAATPIIIADIHIANLFIGQFFFETPQQDFFRKQAAELGFKQEEYLTALADCKVYSKENIFHYLDFFSSLTSMLGESALKTIQQRATLKALQQQKQELQAQQKRMSEVYLANEKALLEQKERLRFIFESTEMGEWSMNLKTHATMRSLIHDKIFGYNVFSEEWSYEIFLEHVVPEDKVYVEESFGMALKNIANWNFECRIIRPDKRIRWIWSCGKHQFDESGKAINIAGIVMDITERKLIEEAINQAKRYNRNLLETSLDPLVTISKDGVITDINAATEQAIGLPRTSIIGTDFSSYFVSPAKAEAGYKLVFKYGSIVDYELDLKNVNGTTMPVLYNAAVYKDEKGEIIGVFAAARNITNTRKFENELLFLKNNLELLVAQRTSELRNTQLLLKSSLESPKDMIILSIDKNYNYYYFNQAHHDAMKYAYNKDVKIDMNLLEAITSDEDRINAKINYDLALDGKSHSTIQKYGDVAVSYYETFYNPVINDQHEIVGATAFARDVSDRILQEEKIAELNSQLEYRVLERTSQLESANKELEAFSYSVSHDLKAPLRHISGYVSMLERKYLELLPDEGRRYLDNIASSAKTMGNLIDGLLQFSRNGRVPMNQKLLNINALVNELIWPIKEQDTEQRIRWSVANLPACYGDYEMIKSVWSNLLENAVKFSRKKPLSQITIGAEEKEKELLYYVKDNGAGFDMNYVSKLFEVFQRLHTQEDYEGTGIGLATIRRIITRHGGKTWAVGAVGKGATFYFSLGKRRESEL
ncbi:MAG: PocR ligand-binding domain-containing protein [Clostridia bacterium]